MEFLTIIGWDPAWGERNPDGLVVAEVRGHGLRVVTVERLAGEESLRQRFRSALGSGHSAWIAMDGPVVCPNATGSRPVDRLAQKVFRAFQAGPHPANRRLCGRIVRVVEHLRDLGICPGFSCAGGQTPGWRAWLAEVFPHPALIRWGSLECTIKYKRGPVGFRRVEFARLQELLRKTLAQNFPEVDPGPVEALFTAPWNKAAEDQLDAFISLLVGWQHVRSSGRETEVLGDLETGFLVVPREHAPTSGKA